MKSLFLESRHPGGEILHKYSKVENPLSADGSWRGIFFLFVFWRYSGTTCSKLHKEKQLESSISRWNIGEAVHDMIHHLNEHFLNYYLLLFYCQNN